MAAFVELHARSAFSFLEGASVPEDLVEACAQFDMPAMAIVDRNGVYGAPRFHMAAKTTNCCSPPPRAPSFPPSSRACPLRKSALCAKGVREL